MNRIIETLMKRDKVSFEEAKSLFDDAKEAFDEMLAEGEVDFVEMDCFCMDWFGLEPDYIDDLMY